MLWLCRDKKIEYGSRVLLMGIVNATPDSFSDGGEYNSEEAAAAHALELVRDGADIIDIGAQSIRPDFIKISPDEEWSRLKDILGAVRAQVGVPVSVDTFYPVVAEKALEAGADIINDVSGTVSRKMAEIVAQYRCGWILMHNGKGNPTDVRNFFNSSVKVCEGLGVDKAQLCFDMGIGFGKSYEENMTLLANVSEYKPDGFPLLLGVSRKSVVGRGSAQDNPKERIYGNIAADTAAVFGGVDIIRLHDVRNEGQGILMAQNMKGFIRHYG